MSGNLTHAREVTFITPSGEMMIRMMGNDAQSICNAARDLKARYFVAQDGFSEAENAPIWGVFDLTRCDPDGAGPRAWAMADPLRTFVTESSDPAVMFAQHLGRL